MHHSFKPGDIYPGFPEEYYFHDSLRGGFQNSLVGVSEEALRLYRTFRSSSRRSESTVVYRCDQSNACLLLEVVPAGDLEYILYLPKFHVSRSEAERVGSALRVYWERAKQLSVPKYQPADEKKIPTEESLLFNEDEFYKISGVELVCRHYILDVPGFVLLQDIRADKIRRFLPGSQPPTRRFGVCAIVDRWDQPDYSDLWEARAQYCKDALRPGCDALTYALSTSTTRPRRVCLK